MKGIVEKLFHGALFPDVMTEQKCIDLAEVRHIVVHQVAAAGKSNVPRIRSPNVIVISATVGAADIHCHELSAAFFGEIAGAVIATINIWKPLFS